LELYRKGSFFLFIGQLGLDLSSKVHVLVLQRLGHNVDINLGLSLLSELGLLEEFEESLGDGQLHSKVEVHVFVDEAKGSSSGLLSRGVAHRLEGEGGTRKRHDAVIELEGDLSSGLALGLEAQFNTLDVLKVELNSEIGFGGLAVLVGDAGIQFHSLLGLGGELELEHILEVLFLAQGGEVVGSQIVVFLREIFPQEGAGHLRIRKYTKEREEIQRERP